MLAKILDFAPALAFFISYRMSGDLILATGIIIACCVLSFALQYLLWRKFSRMQVFLTGAVLLFGLPTILLKDPAIIKWKVTVVNLILASAIFFFQVVLRKNPFAYLLGKELPLPDYIWAKIGLSFIFYFIVAAGLNVIIAFYLPTIFGIDEKYAESLWVDYKTFGNAILNFVFVMVVFFILMRRHPEMMDMFKEAEQGLVGAPAAATTNSDTTTQNTVTTVTNAPHLDAALDDSVNGNGNDNDNETGNAAGNTTATTDTADRQTKASTTAPTPSEHLAEFEQQK